MGTDEQLQIRGQLMTDYLAVKQELADLQVRANRWGLLLEQIGRSLGKGGPVQFDDEGLLREDIQAFIQKLNHAHSRKEALRRQLHQMGLPIAE